MDFKHCSNKRIMYSGCSVVLSANELSSISLDLIIVIMASALSIGTLINSPVMSYDLNSSSTSIFYLFTCKAYPSKPKIYGCPL